MAKDAVFLDEIASDEAYFQLQDIVAINENGFSALPSVTTGNFWRNGLAIGDDYVQDAAIDMVFDDAKMIAESVMGGFARLSH